MPEVILNCPQCQRQLRVTEDLLGRPVKCPACGLTFSVPAAGGEAELIPAVTPVEHAPPPSSRAGAEYDYDDQPEDYDDRPRRRRPPDDWDAPPVNRNRARNRLMPVGVLLILAAAMGILVNIFQILYVALSKEEPPDPKLPEFVQLMMKNAHDPMGMVYGGIFALVSVIILIAAIQMLRLRTHGFALAGTILAMINIGNCCCLIGAPLGVWGLIVLLQPDVRDAFQ